MPTRIALLSAVHANLTFIAGPFLGGPIGATVYDPVSWSVPADQEQRSLSVDTTAHEARSNLPTHGMIDATSP